MTLNLEEIKQSLSGQQRVVQKTEELQTLVDRIFPGYQVVLSLRDGEKESAGVTARRRTRPKPQFSTLSGLDQIERVLEENGEAMKLRDLHTKLVENGGSMSLQTMMSLLSKYQRQNKFRRFGYGLWGLPSQMGDPDEIL
jgi:hypothetical protein